MIKIWLGKIKFGFFMFFKVNLLMYILNTNNDICAAVIDDLLPLFFTVEVLRFLSEKLKIFSQASYISLEENNHLKEQGPVDTVYATKLLNQTLDESLKIGAICVVVIVVDFWLFCFSVN